MLYNNYIHFGFTIIFLTLVVLYRRPTSAEFPNAVKNFAVITSAVPRSRQTAFCAQFSKDCDRRANAQQRIYLNICRPKSRLHPDEVILGCYLHGTKPSVPFLVQVEQDIINNIHRHSLRPTIFRPPKRTAFKTCNAFKTICKNVRQARCGSNDKPTYKSCRKLEGNMFKAQCSCGSMDLSQSVIAALRRVKVKGAK